MWASGSCSLYALKETQHQQNIKQITTFLNTHTYTHTLCALHIDKPCVCVCEGFSYTAMTADLVCGFKAQNIYFFIFSEEQWCLVCAKLSATVMFFVGSCQVAAAF